ncbi:MAG: hypothetical protein QM532_02440 [Cyanobium sp. MAG06]|nr:hypothetical protein [Cyanobium sp. MAG06]
MTKVLIINGGNIKRNRSISSANNIYKEIINSPYKNLSVKMASIDEDNN